MRCPLDRPWGEREIADCRPTFFRGAHPQGEVRPMSWTDYARVMTTPTAWAGTWEHPAHSGTAFRDGYRHASNVSEMFIAWHDFDGKKDGEGLSLVDVRAVFTGLLCIVITTKSYRAELPSVRVGVPLLYSLVGEEYTVLMRERAHDVPASYDRAASADPARFWFGPALVEGGEFHSMILPGAPLDPGPLLLRGARRAELERAELAKRQAEARSRFTRRSDLDHLEYRAVRFLETLEPAIEGAGGSQVTYRAAAVLRQTGFGEERTFRLMQTHYNPRCVPPWPEHQLRRKVREGAKATQIRGLQ